MILLDTNILIRRANVADKDHAVAVSALRKIILSGVEPVIVPQNCYEFWATMTRPPTSNGLGYTAAQSDLVLDEALAAFRMLADPPGLFDEWHRLVVAHACLGRVSYDARLVAAMNRHGVSKILTFNTADFARYPGLTVLDPRVL